MKTVTNVPMNCSCCGKAVYRARVKMHCGRCRRRPPSETLGRHRGLFLATSLGTFLLTLVLDALLRIAGLL